MTSDLGNSGGYRLGEFPHHVYAYLDAEGTYLYIGMTGDLVNRQRAHKQQSPWIGEAETWLVLSTHADKRAALDAEMQAIRRHRPVHNRMHNGDGTRSEAAWHAGQTLRMMRETHGTSLAALAALVPGLSADELERIEGGERPLIPGTTNLICDAIATLPIKESA